MGFFNLFKRKSVAASTPSIVKLPQAEAAPSNAAASSSKHSSIEREHFTLQVPFEWNEVPSDEQLKFEFRNQTLPEQIIVTVLLTKDRFSDARLRQVAEQLTNMRLDVAKRVSGGRAVASPAQFQSGSGQVEARCVIRDEVNNIRAAWVIRVAPAKVVTVALTRYTMQDLGLPFEAYSGLIFDLVQVKNSETMANG